MKKVVSLLLVLVCCLSLCACGESETKELSKSEQQVVDYIIEIATNEFSNSSEIRVLNIGDYQERSKNEKNSYNYGPDTVVVQLQGESNSTKTNNPHYRICLTTTENTSETAQIHIEADKANLKLFALDGSPINRNRCKNSLMNYCGQAGEYVEMHYAYEIENITISFDVAKINLALNEHWESLGL